MECFNCGQEGHKAWQCKWDKELTADELPRQCQRCPRCQKIIYAWDKDVPCETHRTVAGWRDYYHSPQFVTDSAAARERIEDSRSDFRRAHGMPARTEDDLRKLAAQQVAESRAARPLV
jgi:zinc knuckle protein